MRRRWAIPARALHHESLTGRALIGTIGCLVISGGSLFAQGALTPPGAPASTMKSLDQVEARTPISSAPFTISVAGSYYLTKPLSVTTGNAITINADGVTLDLNGFGISSTAASATGAAILIDSGRRNITIAHGHVVSGVVKSGDNYSGSGFAFGLSYSGTAPANVRVADISVSGVLTNGIDVGSDSTVVESCAVKTAGGVGISAQSISNATAQDCQSHGISGYTVVNCYGQSTAFGHGIFAANAADCYGLSLYGNGVDVTTTASNCYGSSDTGMGIEAYAATNCYGHATDGQGMHATTATTCYGFSVNSDGLSADSVTNCHGQANSFAGITTKIAIGSYGFSSNGTGLRATIANSCIGETSTGTAEDVIHKYNMP